MTDTLAAPASHTIEIRHSRFHAQAAAAASVDVALAFLAASADRDATHNCWAYRIGSEYRSSDDGEPAGTAGRPILAAIDGQGYDRVCVVVTRWYGGIKLGAGGLMRAYGGCAAECLRVAHKQELVDLASVEFALGFAELPLLHSRLADFDAHKVGESFDAHGAVLRLRLPSTRIDELRDLLGDLSRGRAQLRLVD